VDILFATYPGQPDLTPSDQLVADALRASGQPVLARPWDAIDPGAGPASLVCLRSTWDYHLRADRFRDWIRGFERGPHRLWNPPETVLWNMDKIYLRELEAQGIPIPRIRFTEPRQPLDVTGLFAQTGWDEAVLKPRISASSFRTSLIGPAFTPGPEERSDLERHGSVLQEFVPEIRTRGEVSLMFLRGQYSHSARKAAAAGEFRVQHNFGGHAEVHQPSPELRALADRVLAAVAGAWVYVRVDVVEAARGPLLMELELIEPDLFFGLAPTAAERFALALREEARKPRG
jgi:glutathione synthase/RimK-type ligase-like ATP-grasp enzyme